MLEFLTQSAWTDRIGWTLVHSLWQFALAAFLAFALQWMLRRRSAAARYRALLLGMALLVAAPTATWFLLPPADVPAAKVEFSPVEKTQNVSPPQLVFPTQPRDDAPALVARPVELPKEIVAAQPPAEPRVSQPAWIDPTSIWAAAKRYVQPWLAEIVLVWLAGVLAAAFRPLFGWRMVRRLRTLGVSPVGGAVRGAFERTAKRLKIGRAVEVLQSSLVKTPMVVGYFRPAILLPLCVVTGLPEAQLELILAHELAHIRRHDYLVNLLQTLVETLFFYHPAVWWLSRQIRNERENCCDDAAMAAVGNRADYGRALLAIEELRAASPALSLAARGGSFLARIQRIAGCEPAPRLAGGGILCVFMASAAILAALALSGNGSASDKTSDGRMPSQAASATPQGFPQAVSAAVRNYLEAWPKPHLSAKRIDAIEKDFERFVHDHQPGDLSAERRVAVLASLERSGLMDLSYLALPDSLKTLKWKLWMAMRREDMTERETKQQTEQREWMRGVVRSLSEEKGLTHQRVLTKLDEAFGDTLCTPFGRPMSEAQFARFRASVEKYLREAKTGVPGNMSVHNPLPYIDSHFLVAAIHAQWIGENGKTLFPLFDNDDKLGWGAGGLNMSLIFGSNRDFRGNLIGLDDFASTHHCIVDATTGYPEIVSDAEAAPDKREAWLATQGRGDFAYDGQKIRIFAVRGAKLLRLDVQTWFDADSIADAELRKRIETGGKDAVPLADAFRRHGSAPGIPGIYIGVLTRQGRLAVVNVPEFSGQQCVHVHTRVRVEGRPANAAGQSGSATIFGRVADTQGRPIAGATVTRGDLPWGDVKRSSTKQHSTHSTTAWTAMTDAEGRFPLPELQPGRHARLEVSAPKYCTKHCVVFQRSEKGDYWPEPERFVVKLLRCATISGRVLGPDGKPLAGAPLSLDTFSPESEGSRQNYTRAITDAQGRFTIDDAMPGPNILYYPWAGEGIGEVDSGRWKAFCRPGAPCVRLPVHGVCAALEFDLTEGGRLDNLTLDLSQCTAVVEGRVLAPDGQPLAGVAVFINRARITAGNVSAPLGNINGGNSKDWSGDWPSPRTDAQGRYKLEGVGPGRWMLHASLSPRYEGDKSRETIQATPGQTIRQDIRVTQREDYPWKPPHVTIGLRPADGIYNFLKGT